MVFKCLNLRSQNKTPFKRGSFESKSLNYYKKGQSGFEKTVMAVIILLVFISMSYLFLSDDFSEMIEGIPLYVYPLLLLGVGLGVASLVKR